MNRIKSCVWLRQESYALSASIEFALASRPKGQGRSRPGVILALFHDGRFAFDYIQLAFHVSVYLPGPRIPGIKPDDKDNAVLPLLLELIQSFKDRATTEYGTGTSELGLCQILAWACTRPPGSFPAPSPQSSRIAPAVTQHAPRQSAASLLKRDSDIEPGVSGWRGDRLYFRGSSDGCWQAQRIHAVLNCRRGPADVEKAVRATLHQGFQQTQKTVSGTHFAER